MKARGMSPGWPAPESPRRRKPRAASLTCGALKGLAAASVSGTRAFLDGGKLEAEDLALRHRLPAAVWAQIPRRPLSAGKGQALRPESQQPGRFWNVSSRKPAYGPGARDDSSGRALSNSSLPKP